MEAAPPPAPAADERRTTPIELLWDLVFVFAITQVTALLTHDLTWRGFGHAMLVIALVWWAWSAFVWAANAADADSASLRAILLAGMLLIFVAGLALPHAFGEDATLFAVTYTAVRLLHLALYAQTSRQGNASWAAISGFAVTVLIGMALLVVGSFLDSTWKSWISQPPARAKNSPAPPCPWRSANHGTPAFCALLSGHSSKTTSSASGSSSAATSPFPNAS